MHKDSLRAKVIMSGYEKFCEFKEIEIYHNKRSKSALIIKSDLPTVIKDVNKIICRYSISKFDYRNFNCLNDSGDCIAIFSIDTSGNLIHCEDKEVTASNFFFFENSEIWLARKENTLLLFDKPTGNKYTFDITYGKTDDVCTLFVIERLNDGIIILGNSIINFKSKSLSGRIMQCLEDCYLFKTEKEILKVNKRVKAYLHHHIIEYYITKIYKDTGFIEELTPEEIKRDYYILDLGNKKLELKTRTGELAQIIENEHSYLSCIKE